MLIVVSPPISRRLRRQTNVSPNMSSRIHQTTGGMPRRITRALMLAAMLALVAQALPSPALAQSDDGDPEQRIQRLEEQLRTLTGQNEELQHQNMLLQQRLQMQGGAPGGPPGQPAAVQPNVATMPPAQQAYPQQQPYPQQQAYPQQQPGYQQGAAPMVQPPGPGRRGDAFDPHQNPTAPGAPRALGGGQMPMEAPVGAPGGREAGAPLNIESTNQMTGGAMPPQQPGAGTRLTTLP